MWSGIKRSLRRVPAILRKVDRRTASLSLGRFRLSCQTDNDPETPQNEGKTQRVKIDYWDLYVRRYSP